MAEAIIGESGWEKWHHWHARIMAPVTDWLCEASGAAPGQAVLDAACGTGLPALALAHRVLPGGRLVATDVSPGMVATTRRNAVTAGLGNLEAKEASLDRLEFSDATFDAATCKDGLMYAADMVKGATELRRVLKRGGRLALTAWDEPRACPFFTTLFQTMGRVLGGPPPDPKAPGPFRLSAPGALEQVLRDAGFAEVALSRTEMTFDFDSVDAHWQMVQDLAAPVQKAATTLPPPELARLRSALTEALAPFVVGGRVRLPAVALCARAVA